MDRQHVITYARTALRGADMAANATHRAQTRFIGRFYRSLIVADANRYRAAVDGTVDLNGDGRQLGCTTRLFHFERDHLSSFVAGR